MLEARPRHAARLALATLVAAALVACGGSAAPGRAAGPGKPVEVVAVPVVRKPWSDVIEALGTAKANESVVLTAKVTETVDRVNFSDGQHVEAGMVLVELSGRAEVANLEEARATLREAEQQYQRQKGLAEAGTIPRSQIDTLVATRDAAKARMQSIRARLGDRVITAPFDGVLGFRKVSAGTLVTPGTEITTLDDISVINLDFTVPELYLSALVARARGRRALGGVARVAVSTAPSARSTRGSTRSRARSSCAPSCPIPRRCCAPACCSRSRSRARRAKRWWCPRSRSARSARSSSSTGWRPTAARSRFRVTLGARRAGEVEVVAGLEEGQQVVTDGLVRMRDGDQDRGQGPATAPVRARPGPAGRLSRSQSCAPPRHRPVTDSRHDDLRPLGQAPGLRHRAVACCWSCWA